MDTKLKSKYKLFGIGILLTILVVLLPAIAMIKFYPYFEERAEQSTSAMSSQIDYDWDSIESSNYVLWMEEQKRNENENITVQDVFLNNIDVEQEMQEEYKDYERNLVSNLNEIYYGWEKKFASSKKNMNYQVYGEMGELISSNTEQNLLDVENSGQEDEIALYVRISYDDIGAVSVSFLNDVNEEVSEYIREQLYTDPLEEYYGYEFANRFQNPQNRTYVYAISNEAAIGNHQISVREGYGHSGDVMSFAFIFSVIVGLLALILPFIGVLGMGRGKIYRAPFELVFLIFSLFFSVNYELYDFVASGNENLFYQWLCEANINKSWAMHLQTISNIFIWMIYFFIVYWIVSCLREIFTLGIFTYIKERVFVCRILRCVLRKCKKVYKSVTDIDFKQNSNKTILKIVGLNFIILTVVCTFWIFGIAALILYSIVLFFLLRKSYEDLQNKYKILLDATNELANGNLSIQIDQNLGVFEPFKEELTKIQSGFKKAVEEETKSQRMKTDLITNVSHDLKTPLTAIITYVNLLKEPQATQEEKEQYVEVLERKSMRLKVLIEDLFEISKATSKNITLDMNKVDVNHLLKQVKMELEDKIEASGIEFRWNLPDEKVILTLDGQKTYRVFENLILNITKYAMPKSRAYVEMQLESDMVYITMKNISADEMNFNENEITERFVRGDMARNSDGSGLGLAIARSFVELQEGSFKVQVEADLFKVEICWSAI